MGNFNISPAKMKNVRVKVPENSTWAFLGSDFLLLHKYSFK